MNVPHISFQRKAIEGALHLISPILKEATTHLKASPLSYGHSGFTGTYVWVDPAYDLIYIFPIQQGLPYQEKQQD